MPIERIPTALAAMALLALAGCTGEDGGLHSTGPAMGEAFRQTMAAQIIDPAPHYEYADPETGGEHAQQAIERYRTDKVKRPDRVRTSNVGSGGGSGGSGGSGGN